MSEIVHRFPGNPIITPAMIPGVNAVFNSAVVPFGDRYAAILRVESRQGYQTMRLAWSRDGIHFEVDPDPILMPTGEPFLTYEEAIYDPRITKIGDIYYICHAAENRYGCQVSVSKTSDFRTFEKVAIASEPTNRNMVLFPEKIGGMYVRLDRPFQPGGQGHIWMCDSPDLIHWGNPRCIMESRRFAWDQGKIGPGAPPIKTDDGWLVIYHGTTPRCNGLIYKAGVALLDLDDPSRVIARGKEYLMAPSEDYERVGDVPNVVFVTSAIPDFEKDEMRLYYGAADTSFCLATARISDLIEFAKTR
ncbi:MAG: glycoside hydrolase family 130 protein [Armatimonadetes bacterium]|nr:glycoside hydrolase family 130 protein [Armatimonadota bacterium]